MKVCDENRCRNAGNILEEITSQCCQISLYDAFCWVMSSHYPDQTKSFSLEKYETLKTSRGVTGKKKWKLILHEAMLFQG